MTAFWATPTMTLAHLVFAAGTTVYMLIAIQFEERNLLEFHGETYAANRRGVPMLVPRIGGRNPAEPNAVDAKQDRPCAHLEQSVSS
jgi:hypothetical protein